jgi:hypothetical protein
LEGHEVLVVLLAGLANGDGFGEHAVETVVNDRLQDMYEA